MWYSGIVRRGRRPRQEPGMSSMEDLYRPNLCLSCERYNVSCVYGTNTYRVTCVEFVERVSVVVNVLGGLDCPACGSRNVVLTYDGRYVCRTCGRLFS